jgi:ribosome-associated toxin RatA of RatAB toxin-antitoxin module
VVESLGDLGFMAKVSTVHKTELKIFENPFNYLQSVWELK